MKGSELRAGVLPAHPLPVWCENLKNLRGRLSEGQCVVIVLGLGGSGRPRLLHVQLYENSRSNASLGLRVKELRI